jgi:hypothetical protein
MMAGVPFVHGREHLVRLVNDQAWTLCNHVELAIGHQDRNLQDSVGLGT